MMNTSCPNRKVSTKTGQLQFWSQLPYNTTPSAAIMLFGGGNVVLENLQFKRVFTDSATDNACLVTIGSNLTTANVTLKNSFIWPQTPADVTFSQKGCAIRLDGYGTRNVENVVIFGDKLKSGDSGWLSYAMAIGNYTANANITNLTVYGRAVDANDEYRGFMNGIYSVGRYTADVSNSYIRHRRKSVTGNCMPYVTTGDYNICGTSRFINNPEPSGQNSNSHADYDGLGSNDFECSDPVPSGGCGTLPDFHLKAGSGLLSEGHTSVPHTESDIEDDPRPDDQQLGYHVPLDVGADEYY